MTAAHEHSGTTSGRGSFWWSKLGSFLAIAPLGVWTVLHVWNNLTAFDGKLAWETAVTTYANPAAQAVTAVVVLAPLLLHTVWGLRRLATSRPNNTQYNYYANLKYLLQRLSAVGVLLFLGAHLWLAWMRPRLFLGRGEPFESIAHEMHFHTPTLVVYLLGTLGVAYHLGNGVLGFCMGWGITSTQRALRRLEWLAMFVFLGLLAMSWGVIYALYRAGGQLPP